MSRDILLSLTDPDPGQPRKHFDADKLAELAASIAANGLAVPILVRPVGDRFIIVHGERRYRAALALNWTAIPAEVRDISPEDARWLALAENVQRADLTPIEEAQAYSGRLAEGITQEALGQRIGKSQSYIAQKLRLLTLPEPLQFYLKMGLLAEGHARQLLRLRAMYFGAVFDPAPEAYAERLDAELTETGAWAVAVPSYLGSLRPEDNPVCWFWHEAGKVPMQDPRWWAIADGCKGFYGYMADREGKVDQWEVTAFWWASYALWRSLSVAQLTKQLDNWYDRFLTAIWWVYMNGDQEPSKRPYEKQTPREKIQDLLYWGYHSDVYHAGADPLVSLPKGVMAAIAEHGVVPGSWGRRSYILPSCCQPWGEHRKLYLELAEQERGQ